MINAIEAEIAAEVANMAGHKIFVIAGNPACRHELEDKGIANFIHIQSNVLEELKEYQKKLGIIN